MEVNTDLPIEIMERVFSNLSVPELHRATLVCTTWEALINNVIFWFRRTHQKGIQLYPELESKLKGKKVDQEVTLNLLQIYCLHKEDESPLLLHDGGSAEDMESGSFWKIKEEDIMVASVLLMSHIPRKLSLSLRSDPSSIRNLVVFFVVLSYNSCDVIIEDLYNWRNTYNSSNQVLEELSSCEKCVVKELWTAVDTIDVLPSTVEELCLSLLTDTATGVARDPGLSRLPERCPRLAVLAVHIRPGMVTEQLPSLPDVEEYNQSGTYLYLSQLTDDSQVQWAVDTAKQLQPPKLGYWWLVLPSCGLRCEQLCKLVVGLAAANVSVKGWVYVSSSHSSHEKTQLTDTIHSTLHCGLVWYQDDERIPYWTYNHYDDSYWPNDSDDSEHPDYETDESHDRYVGALFYSDDPGDSDNLQSVAHNGSDDTDDSDATDDSDDTDDSDGPDNSDDPDNIPLAARMRNVLLHQNNDPDGSDYPDVSDNPDDSDDPEDSDDSDDPDNIPLATRMRHSLLHQWAHGAS